MPSSIKFWFLTIIGLFSSSALYATHITGGELSYRYVSSSGLIHTYEVTLKLYRDCASTSAPLDSDAILSIFAKNASGTFTRVQNLTADLLRRDTLQLKTPDKCIDNPPTVCYEVGVYVFTIELPSTDYGYTLAYQRCCRVEGISNVYASGDHGATYTANIPGNTVADDAPKNSSATYATKDTVIVCEHNFFMYEFSAADSDGDSLSYDFAAAYIGADLFDSKPIPEGPPYDPLPYSFGFGAMSPMGGNVTIDNKTGLVSGIAPAAGLYVIAASVFEYRKGKLINIHRKEIQIEVAACSTAEASLPPEYMSCDSFTVSFQNRNNSPLIKTYHWDFGVKGRDDDVSAEMQPTFTYLDTGTYKLMLITNRGEDCSDTAFSLVKVYPGFYPGFSSTAGCKNVPIVFTDTTQSRYGAVDAWSWNFGDATAGTNTSYQNRPTHTYASFGKYLVSLTVNNSKGCSKTVFKELIVRDRPLLTVPHDTLMCDYDTISLAALGPPGTYAWSPDYNISSLTDPVVRVSPDVSTTYAVSLTTVPGCTSTDTIRVTVTGLPTVDAGPDLLICLTDTVQLNTVSNALTYSWEPAATLQNPFVKRPVATPVDEYTTYTVTAYVGKCFARDTVRVRTVPYPDVKVSNDTSICYGEQVGLFAGGGAYYRWSPVAAISNYTVPDPIVSPKTTTTYTVSVTDTVGCPNPAHKNIIVKVIPPVLAFAGNDTIAVVNQPLQLKATGASSYKWSPGSYLTNTNVADPVATFVSGVEEEVTYFVKVSTPEGCFAYDTLLVRVFKTPPDIFVATAFTPNNDGLNDYFRAMPVGFRTFDYLKIYNRWGQLMFSTTDAEKGWDGKFKGIEQASDSFVWTAKGTDYFGRTIVKKGTMTLIR